MKLVNLLPHVVTLRLSDSTVGYFLSSEVNGDVNIPTSDKVLRMNEKEAKRINLNVDDYCMLPLRTMDYNRLSFVPPVVPDILYIVSLPILQACNRADFIAPDTSTSGGCVRGKDNFIAVRGFVRID